MVEERPTSTTKGRWLTWLLFLTAMLLLFCQLGSRSLWGSEGRWAEVVREMFQTCDFFHPTIGGQPYFDKPLLTYWFIAGIKAVTGCLNEWVIRLPSAIFGFVSIWATVILGRKLWSDQVGRLAGWFLLTSYGILFWSRTAAADTENLAAITLCILWYWVRRDRLNFKTFLIFYLIAFLGALTKGLTAVVVPVIAILPDVVMEKRWKTLLRPGHFLALAVCLGVYAAPFIYAAKTQSQDYQSSGLALVFHENILRYFKPFDHKGPFYLYLYAVPMLVLPWAPLLVASLIGVVPIWKHLDKRTHWLLAAIAMIFLFFSLSGSHRSYYILPILPLCALLMAVFLVYIIHDRTNASRHWGITVQKVAAMGLIGCNVLLPFILFILHMKNHFGFFVELGVSGVIIGMAAWLAMMITDRQRRRSHGLDGNIRPITGLITAIVFIFGGFFLWQQPVIDHFRTERPFIEEVKNKTRDWPAEHIGFFPKDDAKLLFYLDKSNPQVLKKDPSEWDQFLSGGHEKLLIMQKRYESIVPSKYTAMIERKPDFAEDIEPWDSESSSQKKWVGWYIKDRAERQSNNTVIQDVTKHAN